MKIHGFHHFGIHTASYDASLKFYCELLGFEQVKDDLYAPKRLHRTWLKRGPIMIELLSPKCNKPYKAFVNSNEGVAHLSFFVEDIESAYEDAKLFGATIRSRHGKDIYRIKGGKQLKIIAPEGTEIEIRDSQSV